MPIRYDKETDTLDILLAPGVEIEESDEIEPGVIVDYAEGNQIVGIEILSFSTRMAEPVPPKAVLEDAPLVFDLRDSPPLKSGDTLTIHAVPSTTEFTVSQFVLTSDEEEGD